jgi:hypothetical protein
MSSRSELDQGKSDYKARHIYGDEEESLAGK